MASKRYLAPWRRPAFTQANSASIEQTESLHALGEKPAIYHCVSRAVWQEAAFGPAEKEHFVEFLRKWEAFSCVKVLTYCMMSNHFHILVEVPERPANAPSDGDLLAHLRTIYGEARLSEIERSIAECRARGNEAAAEAIRGRFLRRMYDLSSFMKDFKQDCSVWWNHRHGKVGHLWERRFKSVLVEDGHSAKLVAAYIDLNPVRAGLVAGPELYRWCGWAQAVAGCGIARKGIHAVVFEQELGRSCPVVALADTESWAKVCAAYRATLDSAAKKEPHQKETRGVPDESRGAQGRSVLKEGDLLGLGVRCFVDGLVLGSEMFVERVFTATRDWFGRKRISGSRRLAQAETCLRTIRALKVRPYG